jgi:predicted porin
MWDSSAELRTIRLVFNFYFYRSKAMKKSLIALAVAGAVAAPAAFAATANVDVYGKLNLGVSYISDQPDTTSDIQVTSFSSRIGFKGTEDLGGGLAGIWQIESGINPDEQNGGWASRNSFVGLKGGFGTALIGNHDTPLKLVGRSVDLFGDQFGDTRNVLGVGQDIRADNVIAYISPNWTGFSFAAAYSTDPNSKGTAPITVIAVPPAAPTGTKPATDQSAADAADLDVYSLNATYANGPFYVGFAYGDGDYHSANGLGAQYRVAGGFSMGAFKLVGQWDDLEADSNTGLGALGDFDGYMVGASFTMGNWVFKGNWASGDYSLAADPEQWNLGVDYNMSKRTTVYAVYTDGDNVTLGKGGGASDQFAGTSCNVAGYCTGVNQGATGGVQAFTLGVAHTF